MQTILFFTKPGCHLCDDGAWILEIALQGRDAVITPIDITTDPALVARYGTRIPVLGQPNCTHELDWPFTPDTILDWLETNNPEYE